jgi:branched-chain amino acid aminotransferase
MHRFVLHNDEIRASGDLILSPGQVGLMNGWGVFSTIRVYDGVMFEWHRHFDRMRRDAALIRVPFPEDSAWLEERLNRLIDANQAWNATLRVNVVRNQGGMFEGPAPATPFDVLAFTRDVKPWGEGARLGVIPRARHAASEFAGAKIMSWSDNLIWYQRAQEQGLDEVILLNERDEVCECTSANIFLVQGSRAWTPPLASGCLPGITRAVLLEKIQVPGIEIAERTIVMKDLETADEVFITSTTRELLPVISIEGLNVCQGRQVRDRLQAAFTEYVQAYVAPRRRPVPALK